MQKLRHAVVRGATPADFLAAIETEDSASSSLDGTLHMLSLDVTNVDQDPAVVFTGDGGPAAVIEYVIDHATGVNEVSLRQEFPDWLDWSTAPPEVLSKFADAVAKQDEAFGRALVHGVLMDGWAAISDGIPVPVETLARRHDVTGDEQLAAYTGSLSVIYTSLETMPESVMSGAEVAALRGAILAYWAKWPRAVDSNARLPPQVWEMSADFTFEIQVPVYRIDASGGPVIMSLPKVALAGVTPNRVPIIDIVGADGVNTVTIQPWQPGDGDDTPPETIDGAGSLVITAPATFRIAGTYTEWTRLG